MSGQSNDNGFTGILCYGVEPGMTCHFDGACYGEICIAPNLCRKKTEELNDIERAHIKRFNAEHDE